MCLSIVWRATVIDGVYLAVAHYEESRIAAVIAAIMAIAMLVVFVPAKLPKQTQVAPSRS